MSTADIVISAAATGAVPKDYVVKPSQEIIPLCVTASVDGSGAASAFLATLEFISDAGLVMGRFPCQTLVAAAGSADVSWFHLNGNISGSSSQSAYEQLILSNPHLRAYYKLDELSGTVMFDSGPLALNGTYVTPPTLGQPPLADGHSALFAAASLEYGYATNLTGAVGTGELTVVAWFKTPGAGGSIEQIISADDNNFRYFQFRVEAAGQLTMINFDAPAFASVYPITSPGTVTDNARHMGAGTLDTAGTQTLYLDGAQVAQNVAALPSLSTRLHEWLIGGRLSGGPPVQNPFQGYIDEVSVYNFNLSAADILAIYNAGIA